MDLNQNASPNTNYARKSFKGGGRSSVVNKSGGSGSNGKNMIGSGIQAGDKTVGTKRFDVTSKSLNRGSRKM